MPDLFPVYRGSYLEVPMSLHLRLMETFPWCNVLEQYRIMDLWLNVNPKRRPKRCIERFIVTWIKRQPRPSLKDMQAQKEISVGQGPTLPEGVRMKPEAVQRYLDRGKPRGG